MNSASDITIGSLKPLRPSMSNTTIFCSVGQRARHARILSSCSSSSAKITRVAESLIRYSTWTAESGGMQTVGNVLGDLQPLPPAGRLPDAELLLTDRWSIAARLHGEQNALRDRVGDGRHCRAGHAWP